MREEKNNAQEIVNAEIKHYIGDLVMQKIVLKTQLELALKEIEELKKGKL